MTSFSEAPGLVLLRFQCRVGDKSLQFLSSLSTKRDCSAKGGGGSSVPHTKNVVFFSFVRKLVDYSLFFFSNISSEIEDFVENSYLQAVCMIL